MQPYIVVDMICKLVGVVVNLIYRDSLSTDQNKRDNFLEGLTFSYI